MILIRIETANAAFAHDEAGEVARMLEAIAERMRENRTLDSFDGRPLFDVNGNTVGIIEARSEAVPPPRDEPVKWLQPPAETIWDRDARP